MEADSTTSDVSKTGPNGVSFPFISQPPPGTVHRNLQTYLDIITKEGQGSRETRLIRSLQSRGLISSTMSCPRAQPGCRMNCVPARVNDRMQWVCEGCGAKQSIRNKSFFLRIPCSLLQVLQIMLAWCEDADCDAVAQHFGIKAKVAHIIYDKLDNLAAKEQSKTQLGNDGAVVLAEMYPDCLTRLSPDTSDQPHGHRILMLADTKHIPTQYSLNVIKENKKNMICEREVYEVMEQRVSANSTLVVGNYVPMVKDAASLQSLLQHCDADMQHFLCNRIWRQALTLCAASRDLCPAEIPSPVCCSAVQRYLDAALHRLRYAEGFFSHTLALVAREYTLK